MLPFSRSTGIVYITRIESAKPSSPMWLYLPVAAVQMDYSSDSSDDVNPLEGKHTYMAPCAALIYLKCAFRLSDCDWRIGSWGFTCTVLLQLSSTLLYRSFFSCIVEADPPTACFVDIAECTRLLSVSRWPGAGPKARSLFHAEVLACHIRTFSFLFIDHFVRLGNLSNFAGCQAGRWWESPPNSTIRL